MLNPGHYPFLSLEPKPYFHASLMLRLSDLYTPPPLSDEGIQVVGVLEGLVPSDSKP